MQTVAAVAGVALVLFVLAETFEVLVLPRRVTRRFRFARLYYRNGWRACSGYRSPRPITTWPSSGLRGWSG